MVADDKIAIVLPTIVKKYVIKSGKCPFDQWMKKHKKSNIGVAVDQVLDRVESGYTVKVKAYGGKVGAIILSWPRKIRIYYGVDDDSTIVLLGGDDSDQTGDINNAKKYWKDYLSNED